MIEFKTRGIRNPKSGELQYYAQVAGIKPVGIRELTREVSYATAMTKGEVYAVLCALEECITTNLLNGNSVRLGLLGSFRPVIRSYASETAAEVNAENIKSVNVVFTKGATLRDNFRMGSSLLNFRSIQGK